MFVLVLVLVLVLGHVLCGGNRLPAPALAAMLGNGGEVDALVVGLFQSRKYPDAVPHLIEALAKAEKKFGVVQALKAQTGQDFGEDAQAWKKWHEKK